MPDVTTVVTSVSWFTRIKNAFFGVLFGLAMIAGAFVLLWWNEGRAVHRTRDLKEGAGLVVDVPADRVDPANDGKLVHLSALATTDEKLTDTDFGVSAVAIRLSRIAELYQWRETTTKTKHKRLGGSEETTTTYSYDKAWSRDYIDSSKFHEPSGHENPSPRWVCYVLTAQHVAFGAFELSPDLVSKVERSEPRRVRAGDEGLAPDEGFRVLDDGTMYRGTSPSAPQLGDVRVRYEVTLPQTVSVVAVQRGNSFESYQGSAGSTILLLREGNVGAAEMFKSEQLRNMVLAWALRAAGFFLMFLGFALIFKPLSVIGSVVPFVGSIVAAGTGALSFFLALILSLTTIALAWLAYRPMLAGGLFAGAVVAIVLLARAHRRKRRVVPPPILAGPPPIPTGH